MKKRTKKNRRIKTDEMISRFINATSEIIDKEGIDNVTIRKIADAAGFNSATIYNYFEDLSHLIFFASMSVIKKYTDALPRYIEKAENPLERYFLIWECFCKFSFSSPKVYYAVFSANLGTRSINMAKYYEYSPYDLVAIPDDDIKAMLLEASQSKRVLISLQQCIKEGYILEEDAEEIALRHYLIWQGMLTMFINNRSSYTVEEATRATLNHIRNDKYLKVLS